MLKHWYDTTTVMDWIVGGHNTGIDFRNFGVKMITLKFENQYTGEIIYLDVVDPQWIEWFKAQIINYTLFFIIFLGFLAWLKIIYDLFIKKHIKKRNRKKIDYKLLIRNIMRMEE